VDKLGLEGEKAKIDELASWESEFRVDSNFNHELKIPKAGLLRKSSCLAVALGEGKFNVRYMQLDKACCDTLVKLRFSTNPPAGFSLFTLKIITGEGPM
jgi:hypothetical protein